MSPDEAALLNAVAPAPAEDLPRLVYADWLDEHGRPARAEFIRLQCEIARLETGPRSAVRPTQAPLWVRQEELLEHHRGELLGPLAALPAGTEVEFDRGFVTRVVLPVADYLVHGPALDAARPRPRVRVTRVAGELVGFLRSTSQGCVSELSGFAPGVATNPPDWPDYADVDLLDAADRLNRLEVLDLEGCGIADWMCDLYYNFTFPSLVELDLSNNEITDVGVDSLLRSPLPKRVVLGGNPITDAGAVLLAERLRDSAVENLNVRGTLIGPAGHRALLAAFDREGKKVDLF